MLQVKNESSVIDSTYSFQKDLKDIQETIETIDVLPVDVEDQIAMQNIRIKNAIGKIKEFLQKI